MHKQTGNVVSDVGDLFYQPDSFARGAQRGDSTLEAARYNALVASNRSRLGYSVQQQKLMPQILVAAVLRGTLSIKIPAGRTGLKRCRKKVNTSVKYFLAIAMFRIWRSP